MSLAFLRGLEKAPTFLVPIINPPFADNSPHLSPAHHRGAFGRNGAVPARRPKMDKKEIPAGRYERIYTQLVPLLSKTKNKTARMATIAALLHLKMPRFFWTGFYVLDKGELTVGPYQGPLACLVLEKKKGVCWAGLLRRRTVIVPDVHKFPGHIACDSRSRSEIVVPLFDSKKNVWGVLDIDSREFDAFSETDKVWLEKIVSLI
jgi:L-methionine (R)-S-oxide reductase